MNPDVFFKNFELLADTPNGVQKLRELILQLAVRGKLVPRDPNDEPASALIERINAEKKRLTKEGKIKASEPLPEISDNEILFEIPETWKWIRFDNICSYIQRGKSPNYVEESDFPVISQKCIQWDGLKIDRAKFIDPSTIKKYEDERFLRTGDLLWNSTGTGTIGRVNVYVHEENSYDNVVADTHVTVVRPLMVNSYYLYYWIASPIVQKNIENIASGSTNQIELATSTAKNHFIPLPPLAEQKRIVSKVNELMALCDKLEARRQKKQEIQIKLNSAALDRMLSAENQKEFEQNWQPICENFDILYDNPGNVEKLKQAILQLAVQGKLVPQNPEDEPAEMLLEKIRGEKERLVKEGIIRNFKLLPPIEENEIPYELPKEWQWVRLEDLVSLLGDGLHGTPEYSDLGDYFFINGNNLRDGKIVIKNDTKRVSIEEYNKYKKELNERTVLVSINGTLGNVAFYNNERVILGKSACYFNLLPSINKCYLKLLINTSYFLEYAFKNATGTTIKNVSLKSMRLFLVPLPSLAEQKRIVEKVEHLMGLCDELEAKLRKEREDSEKLMEAVVKGLLEGAVAEKTELEKPIPLQAAVVKLK